MSHQPEPTQMQRDALMLHARVNEYRLTVAKVTFWTPYWINHDHEPYFLNAPLMGKGTPQQITDLLGSIVAELPEIPTSPEDMRQLMNKRGLGVDCSAFVYHVLDGWLRWRGLGSLSDHIFFTRDEVIAQWQAYPENKGGQVESDVPDFVPVSEIAPIWKRDPIRVASVSHLCNPVGAVRISRLNEMRPGDMIRLTGSQGSHMGVIVEVLADRLIWAQSGRVINSDGVYDLVGVEYQDIKWVHPEADLDQQDWTHEKVYKPENGLDGVWRLKVLDGA